MSSLTGTWCRLCLELITDKHFEVIEDSSKNVLSALLPKLRFDDKSTNVMCGGCSKKLNAAFEFKSKCLNTNNAFIQYVTFKKTLLLDLREAYFKERKRRNFKAIPDDQEICCLCLQLVSSEFRCVCKEEVDAVQKFIPQMNISIVKDPFMCRPCFDSLCTHNTFLENCLRVDERICDSTPAGSQNDTSPFGLFIKTENLDIKCETNDMEMSVKPEYVEMKSEEFKIEHVEIKSEVNEETSGTKQKAHLIPDLTEDKDSSQAQKYKCDKCNFVTTRKRYLVPHVLIHKDPSQVRMYKCDICDYKSKAKAKLIGHQLTHKSPSELQMYECKDCSFKTKHKGYLVFHQLKHKDASQVQIYKCEKCNYQSWSKKYFKRHQVVHLDPSEARMYKCDKCDYETMYKQNLLSHKAQHKIPGRILMYKCDLCNFQSRFKWCAVNHESVHL